MLNIKNAVVESHGIYNDQDGVTHIRIKARPNVWHKNDCPFCGRHCQGYDQPTKIPKVRRGLDWGGILVEIEYSTHRVCCPKHGVVTAAVPWAYPGSSFTKEFDLTVTWLAKYLPRSAVANFMRIDWQTVGSCISRSLHDLEPERSRRLDGLVRIGIDETSYHKGHKYITVIVNHDTNTVVWVADGHGRSVLEQFYKTLTDEKLASIKVVTGGGARWITDCVNEFLRTASAALFLFMWLNGPWKLWTRSAGIAGAPLMRRLSSWLQKTRRNAAVRRQLTRLLKR